MVRNLYLLYITRSYYILLHKTLLLLLSPFPTNQTLIETFLRGEGCLFVCLFVCCCCCCCCCCCGSRCCCCCDKYVNKNELWMVKSRCASMNLGSFIQHFVRVSESKSHVDSPQIQKQGKEEWLPRWSTPTYQLLCPPSGRSCRSELTHRIPN